MNMLFLSPALKYGGSHKMIVWLANRFMMEGNDVTMLTYNEENRNKMLQDTIKKESFNIPIGNNFFERNFFFLPKSIILLLRYIHNNSFDIIISFTDTVSIISMFFIKKIFKKRFFISERMDPYTNTGFSDKLRRYLFRYSDGIIFQTEEAKKYFEGKLKIRQCVIPNPVISNYMEKTYTCREQKIVSVGRLDIKQKRQDLLLHAFVEVAKEFPDIRLEIFGDGDDEQKLRTMVLEENLNDRVIFAGVTDNVYDSIYNAKLFVMTSDFEGVPNALIEAMAIGVPVVSTDCSPGGAKTLIENKVNGMIVPRNDVNALADAIRFMLNNEEIAEKMAETAKKIKEKYNEDKIFQRWRWFIENTD